MKQFFQPNLDRRGRLVRGFGAVGVFIAAGFVFRVCVWGGIGLVAFGVFMMFEALRGWCGLRACGIKTRL